MSEKLAIKRKDERPEACPELCNRAWCRWRNSCRHDGRREHLNEALR